MAAQPMRIALRLPHTRCFATPEAILRVAEAADRLGFWGVSVEDHILAEPATCAGSEEHQGKALIETLQTLAFVAGRTSRVRLITGVVVLPYRNPILLAKELASLDVLSGGRLTLGVGVGALRERQSAEGVNLAHNARIAAREFDAFGVHGDRGPILDEYLDAMEVLWTQDPASYHGQHVDFDDMDMYPRPVQRPRPPIWLGGRSDKSKGRVARRADGWYPSQCSVEILGAGRQTILQYAEEIGREVPPSDFGVCDQATIMPTDAEARRWMTDLYGYRFTSEEAMWGQTITGSPQTVLDRIAEYAAVGATFLDLRILPISVDAMIEQIELFAAEVLPELGAGVTTA